MCRNSFILPFHIRIIIIATILIFNKKQNINASKLVNKLIPFICNLHANINK
jgi:hypothetical protein